MTLRHYLAVIVLLLLLFAGAVFVAEAAYDGVRLPPNAGELVIPAQRDPARWGDARCNDGTPYAFVVQPSPSNSPVWVIYLQGGQLCDDTSFSCAERDRNLTTALPGSDGSAVPMIPHDLLSRDASANPTFHDANFAYGHYCTSDLWSGNSAAPRPNSASASGWYFTGRIDLRAMVEVLQARYRLDDSNPATQVLFAGSSAGGVGVIVNADTVASLLPNAAADQRLRLLVDGGYFPEFDDPSYHLGDVPASLPDIFSGAYDFWGSSLNPLCEQAQIAAGDRPSLCFFGAPSYPYLTAPPPDGLGLPYLVAEASIDADFFSVMNIRWRSRADHAAVELWRSTAIQGFDGVSWLFSAGDQPYHILLPGNGWLKDDNGVTLRDLITSFWDGGTPQRLLWGNP